MIDHDRLFKELLTNFFFEFIELFLPRVSEYLDRGRLEFLDKEVWTDVTAGERHEADLVAKVRFRDADAFFLIHVETQSTARPDFARRMFRYFARLHERHDLPIYPIALFSYDAPLRPEPDRFQVTFPDKLVLDFSFQAIQLNRLNWRDYLRQANPVASALMAKMNIAPEDRPRVKLECLRLLTTLKLNPAKMQLIAGFVNSYLRLDPAETRVFAEELDALPPTEKEPVMNVTNEWTEMGFAKGLHRGKEDLVLRQLRRRFGEISTPLQERINGLPEDQLDQLAEALLDFASLSDAEAWVSRQG
jgi:hypothetical protein